MLGLSVISENARRIVRLSFSSVETLPEMFQYISLLLVWASTG